MDTETANVGLPSAITLRPAAPPLRVLVVADDGAVLARFRSAISLSGLLVAADAATTDQATQTIAARAADAVVLALPFQGDSGLAVCGTLQAAGPIPVVVVADQMDPRLISECAATGVVGCVGKSASIVEISTALSLGAAWFRAVAKVRVERDTLAEQNRQLLQTLENRKLIERAKGIYMRVLGLQEAEAHRRLQQESQKRRLAITELARKIIESDDLLGRN